MHLLPTQEEVVRVLRDTGALRDGHFVYPSGLHSNEYLQVPLAMRYYQHARTLSVGLSRLLRAPAGLWLGARSYSIYMVHFLIVLLLIDCAKLLRFGGIDLQLLGIGQAGHIGFNEPLSAFRSRTRVKTLAPLTLQQNAEFFGGTDRVPRRAIPMGVGTILESRRSVLLATGAGKAEIIATAVEGPITAMISATALQLHARCTVVVDEAAAQRLAGSEYYRRIFATEPEWEVFRGPD